MDVDRCVGAVAVVVMVLGVPLDVSLLFLLLYPETPCLNFPPLPLFLRVCIQSLPLELGLAFRLLLGSELALRACGKCRQM